VCTGISMPLTPRQAMCIGKICAHVNTAGRVVSRTKMAIHKAVRVYSHFVTLNLTLSMGISSYSIGSPVSLKVPPTHRLCHRPTGSVRCSVKATAGENIESKCELQLRLAAGGM